MLLKALPAGILRSEPSIPLDWLDENWSHRARITAQSAQILEAYPYALIIDLQDHFAAESAFWGNINPDGSDIRITKGDGLTEVARGVRGVNTGTEVGVVYVHHPVISASADTHLYIYWGNAEASDHANTDALGMEGTWAEESIVAHWTFDSEDGAEDRSGNGHHGTFTGASLAPGQVDDARDFSGTNQYFEAPDDPALNVGTTFTLMAWINPDAWGQNNQGRVFDKAGGSGGADGWTVYIDDTDSGTGVLNSINIIFNNDTAQIYPAANDAIALSTWQHWALTLSSAQLQHYINGATSGSLQSSVATPAANSDVLRIGMRSTDLNREFDGRIDDPRIYSRALSPDECATIYNNQNDNRSFWSRGAVETQGSTDGSNAGNGGASITDITFDSGTHRELAPGSDNWPMTWADDGHQYTSWGDGGGFGGTNSDGRVSLGYGRIEGDFDSYTAHNVWGGKDAENPPQTGGKSYGLVCIRGVLYSWVGQFTTNTSGGSNPSPGSGPTHLYKSTDHGATWTDTGVEFNPANLGGAFSHANILNFGQDYGDARDGFMYTYFVGEKPTGFHSADEAYLTRVPITDIETQSAYEVFAGFDGNGDPTWSSNLSDRAPVWDEVALGVCWTFNVVYIAPLKRYLFITNLNDVGSSPSTSDQTDLAFYQGNEPWGPWTHVKTFTDWRPPTSLASDRYNFFWDVPAKWIGSPSGNKLDFTVVFSGTGTFDSWNTLRGTLTVESGS